jgi:hypothetical protein
MKSTRYSCQILMKLEFPRRDFLKSSNIKFHENSSSWSEVVPYRPSDRHNEVNSLLVQFCERAYKMKNSVLETLARFFLAGMKAQGDEGGERILLGGNAGGGAVVLRRSCSSVLDLEFQLDPLLCTHIVDHIYTKITICAKHDFRRTFQNVC